MSGDLFTVGKVVNTHGLKGELKVFPQTDFPETRFARGSELILFHPEQQSRLPVTVESARTHKNAYIVKLRGFDNINEVEKYKGWQLKVSGEFLADLPDGEYYYHQIIGCKVITEEERELGEIAEILSPGANDVWVVRRAEGRDLLLPVIDDVVLRVNVPQKTVTVRLMEGLLDE